MDPIYWVVGGMGTTGAALLGIIYSLINKNTSKLNEHDVLFAKLHRIPDNLEGLTSKVNDLIRDVAVIRNSCMYVPHNHRDEK